jgi:hypothetical protein
MAHIIQFPNSAPAPVQQRRGPGRHPKSIVSLWRARVDRNVRRMEAAKPVESVDSARDFVRAAESILFQAKHELLIAQRRSEGKQP